MGAQEVQLGRIFAKIKIFGEIWRRYLALGTWPQADQWLNEQKKSYPQMGSRDRRWLSEVFFTVLRHLAFAETSTLVLQQRPKLFSKQDTSECLLELKKSYLDFQKRNPTASADQSSLETLLIFACLREKAARDADPSRKRESPRAKGRSACEELLAALSLQAQKKGEQPEEAPEKCFSQILELLSQSNELWAQGLSHSLPAPLLDALGRRRRLSQENQSWDPWLKMQLSRPPTWLKVRKGLRPASLAKELIAELEVCVVEERPGALAIQTERSLQNTKAFLRGDFEIQDLASQLMVEKMQVQPGDRVWDACAGGGGKSMGIAAALHLQGRLYASDLRPWKLAALAQRAKRGGHANIATFPWQAPKAPDFGKPTMMNAYVGYFDRILIDAPCSGSGTWRRSPDGKLRIGSNDLQALQDLQLQMIETALPYLKPQGRFFYGTCSYYVEENEELIEKALATIPGITLVQQSLLGCPAEDCDTMFLAELKRT